MTQGRPLTAFIGRERALREARDLIGEARLVTVTGPGGIGKTRLAYELAARVDRAFPGAHVVELAALDARADVATAVAAALSVPDQSNTPPLRQVARHLDGARTLLVVDNCEHLLDSAAATIAELLSKVSGLSVVATSREPLGVPGEHSYILRPMALPRPGSTDRGTVEEAEAVRLLVDRARGFAPTFTITDGNRGAVARLCERFDGMPLAIELAAARLRSLSAEQVLARLDQRVRTC
ncbi:MULTISPECIES: ATP-binding protein [unclassified Nocardioides]|uniref:ATP-binding protein n=1 Tax=unclassified Nocardioides TaxID=2615069 RepID=UPI0007039AF2|nr:MULTISPECIES: AAA family ATPase [unclassified Nocardioides]KRC46444.1 hypothetical protein ASE19_21705 [Nocardioides sp. Root79]KRC69789.1 hypothetical protein ASE20_14565 [Nocardioides sp. Root240]